MTNILKGWMLLLLVAALPLGMLGCPADDDDDNTDDDDASADDDDATADDDDATADDDDDSTSPWDGTIEGTLTLDPNITLANAVAPYSVGIAIYNPADVGAMGPAAPQVHVEVISVPSFPHMYSIGYTAGSYVNVGAFIDDTMPLDAAAMGTGDVVGLNMTPATVSATGVDITINIPVSW